MWGFTTEAHSGQSTGRNETITKKTQQHKGLEGEKDPFAESVCAHQPSEVSWTGVFGVYNGNIVAR